MATLTVQTIIDASTRDMRKILSSSNATDQVVLIDYADRIHQDVLHSSLYNHLVQGMETLTTVAGTSSYAMTATDVRRALFVYDRTFNRDILPVETLVAPLPTADQATEHPGQVNVAQVRADMCSAAQGLYPKFYRTRASISTATGAITTTVHLFPAPATAAWAGSTEVYYEKVVPALTLVTSNVTLPDDAKDTLIAGVNYLTAKLLERLDLAAEWQAVYEKRKRGELII